MGHSVAGVHAEAPSAGEKLLAGQGMGLIEERGQKAPAGHSWGVPEEQ